MSERVSPNPLPMASLEFQDFLKQQRLMTVGDLNPDRWALIPSPSGRDRLLERVWAHVIKTPGYLVPGPVIASDIYGFSDKDELGATYALGKSLQGNIEDSQALFVSRVGQGLGVESLNPSNTDWIDPLYAIWQNLGKFIHPDVLFQRLYDRPIDEASRHTVYLRYYGLIERLRFKNAVIEGASFNFENYFRLRVLNGEEKKNKKNGMRWVYTEDFQDWLGKAGVVTYLPDKEIELKDGCKFSKPQEGIVDLLLKRRRQIIPFDKIADFYWDKGARPDNWRHRLKSSLYSLRVKCANPDSLFLAPELGWGFGIEDLHLSKANLLMLNTLRESEGDFVESARLSEVSGVGEVRQGVKNIRKQLRNSPYLIGSSRGEEDDEGADYIFIDRNYLVTSIA